MASPGASHSSTERGTTPSVIAGKEPSSRCVAEQRFERRLILGRVADALEGLADIGGVAHPEGVVGQRTRTGQRAAAVQEQIRLRRAKRMPKRASDMSSVVRLNAVRQAAATRGVLPLEATAGERVELPRGRLDAPLARGTPGCPGPGLEVMSSRNIDSARSRGIGDGRARGTCFVGQSGHVASRNRARTTTGWRVVRRRAPPRRRPRESRSRLDSSRYRSCACHARRQRAHRGQHR